MRYRNSLSDLEHWGKKLADGGCKCMGESGSKFRWIVESSILQTPEANHVLKLLRATGHRRCFQEQAPFTNGRVIPSAAYRYPEALINGRLVTVL